MIKLDRKINDAGTIRWYIAGTAIQHKDDGPAVEYANGDRTFYKHGLLHREDGPAIDWPYYSSPKKQWYYNGKQINCSTLEEFKRMLALKAFW